jgi:hypothetical protein
MTRLLAVIAVALALPGAAQGKEITALSVCGPTGCEEIDLAGFGHNDPIVGVAGNGDWPPPSDFLRIDFTVDGQKGAFSVFYEPDSGLVSVEGLAHSTEWARLAPPIATAVRRAAKRLEAFPAPRVTGVKVGERTVAGDASSYIALLTVEGPYVLPKTEKNAEGIRFETVHENPWTRDSILFYSEDGLIMRGGTFIKLPGDLAADVAAARALHDRPAGRATLPWIAIGTALAGLLFLLSIGFRRAPEGRAAPVH